MKSLFENEIPDDHLFMIKPAFIGEITNAFSSLRENSSRLSTESRNLVRAGIIIACIVGGWFAVASLEIKLETKLVAAGGCGLIGIFLALSLAPSAFHNAFVGTEGMAEYTIEPKTRDAKGLQNVKFKEASFLLTETIDKYEHGIYKITNYNFRWYNEKAEVLSESKSVYRKGESPKQIETSLRYFSAARFILLSLAENSWNQYLKKNISKITTGKNKDEYRFYLMDYKGNHIGFIYIRPKQIAVETEKQTFTFGPQDIREIAVEEGAMKFAGTDYKEYLSNIGNASLFIEMANLWLKANS